MTPKCIRNPMGSPMKIRYTFLLLFAAGIALQAQDISPRFNIDHYRLGSDAEFREQYLASILSDTLNENLIVGFPNENEIKDVNTSLTVYGDIIVVNNGQLRFNDVDVRVHGNVFLLNAGKLQVTGGSFGFVQQYLYHRNMLLQQTSSLLLNNTSLNFGGYNVGLATLNQSSVLMVNSTVTNGYMTTTLLDSSQFTAQNSTSVGEFVMMGESDAEFTDCTGILSWLTTPPGSNLEIQFPGDAIAGQYHYPDSVIAASGILNSASYDGCFGLLWGMINESGSTARIHNSALRAVGAIFNHAGDISVSGLTNGATLSTYQYPAADRDIRFVNSYVETWNLYPSASSSVAVTNCIFGEILAMGKSRSMVTNSICDGSGGYVGSTDTAQMTMVQCQIAPDVVAKSLSQIFMTSCNIPDGAINTDNDAIIGLFNCTFGAQPRAGEGSGVLIMGVDDPTTGYVDDQISIKGSAFLIGGPEFPAIIDQYWLEFGLSAIPDDRRPIGSPSILPKYKEELGIWDTQGLDPGQYNVYVNLKLNLGTDTITVPRQITLDEKPVSVENPLNPGSFSVSQSYPNPVVFGNTATIDVQLPGNREAVFMVFDALGRVVDRRTVERSAALQIQTSRLAPGIYRYVLGSGGTRKTGTMTVIGQ